MTARFFIICYLLSFIRGTNGFWIRPSIDASRSSFHSIAATVDSGSEIVHANELQSSDDHCWQNMLDDDCSMGNIYAANFVASKWIQSMPCGEGIEDCDMPAALSSPDARPEAGVDQMDVMQFLGLKRAISLSKKLP